MGRRGVRFWSTLGGRPRDQNRSGMPCVLFVLRACRVRAARRAGACARPSPAASERSEFASSPSVSCSSVPSCVLSCVLTREGPSGWGNDGKCLYLGCWECVRSCVRAPRAGARAPYARAHRPPPSTVRYLTANGQKPRTHARRTLTARERARGRKARPRVSSTEGT